MIDFRTTDGLVAVATHSRGIFTTKITSVNDVLAVHHPSNPPTFHLSNYPNPFNNSTAITFSLKRSSAVTLNIYDLKGRMIQTLANKELSSGEHRFEFSAEGLSSGVYYCILKTNEAAETRKLLIIK